jgi:hypothetical protein
MGFTITCNECKSTNCHVSIPNDNGKFVDYTLVCNDCGHEV